MTRRHVGPALLDALEAAGVAAGNLHFLAIWGQLAGWLQEPAVDVEPAEDCQDFYLSQTPATVDDADTPFSGESPVEIAGQDLICVEFGRRFARRVGPFSTVGLGGATVTLWYLGGPAWRSLRETPEWIDMGPATCNYDWSTTAETPDVLVRALEPAPVLAICSAQSPLALTASYTDENANGPDPLVVIAG
jgi:hypothetical protein